MLSRSKGVLRSADLMISEESQDCNNFIDKVEM